MFDKTTVTTVVQNKLGTVGYSLVNPNRFISIGYDGLYIQSDLRFKIFNDIYLMHYIRNIPPAGRTPSSLSFDHVLYPGSFDGYTDAFIISDTPFVAAFGQKFNSATYYLYVDMVANTIKTSSEIFYAAPTNYNTPIYVENQTYSIYNFFFASNSMFQISFDPKYETLCYPGKFDFRGASLEFVFETMEKDSTALTILPPASFNMSNSITCYRPKLIFMPHGLSDYYYYNSQTSSFVECAPAGDYFTFNEMRSAGNTFTEYFNIPRDKFLDLYNGRWQVLVNNYLLPIYISNRFWTENYDLYQFLWPQSIGNKILFVMGNM